MNGYFGHSNDSLFASADEMAGDYSPHNDNDGFTPTRATPTQPHNDNDEFTPIRATPTQPEPPTQPPTSRGSTGHRSGDSQDVEIDYPMPDQIEIWKQTEHPDSINKLLNITGDMCQEIFRGAAKMLSHANPETFEMPLKSRFICMKVDRETDMKYCLANGAVTSLPSCNERIDAVWRDRDGERVFMMFSISGQKEFCAMAEMAGPVERGSMPGWSKPGCEGLVFVTFIYVKNVPFSLINHIKHKSNGQPVANMWNSMMYHDNTGYHVARIYCEHPVLSSVLVKIHTEVQVNYKSQLRIPTSGNTTYSASSFGSQNDKSHDPRSATKPHVYRSGNRGLKSNASWWRSDGIPPTPSRQPGTNATSTSVALVRHRMHQQDMNGAAQSPPPFALPNSGSSGFNTAGSFTTADDRMIAEFAHFRDAKRLEANQKVPSGSQHVETAIHDPFRVDRTPHNGQTRDSFAINPDRHGKGQDRRNGHSQSTYGAQWQGNRRVAPASVYSNNSGSVVGFDNALGATGPYHHQGRQQAFYATNAMPPQPTSPVTSSYSSHHGSAQSNEIRRQQSQGFGLRSPPSYNFMQSRRGVRGHGHPVPQSNAHVAQNTTLNPLHGRQQQAAKPGSPIKHSQSIPAMIADLTHRLSAQHLHSHNSEARTDNEATVPASPSIQDWVELTPTRGAPAKQSPNRALTVKTSTNLAESPEKAVRSADIADRLKWHQAMASALEIEIKMAGANGHTTSEKQDMLKYHNAKVVCYEVELAAAHREHQDACGELAKSTVNHPPTSQGTPNNSALWPTWAHDSSVESDLITPVVDEYGKILRSVSKTRAGKATHVGQKIRHRRGNVAEFTRSFDERMNATVQDLIRSPKRVSSYVASRPARTHGHPPQQCTAVRPAHGQHDSCTEEQQYNEDDRYHYEYSHNDQTFDFASQVGAPEDDDEPFSPRGRGYQHTQSARDASQMSYNGGIKLGGGPEQK